MTRTSGRIFALLAAILMIPVGTSSAQSPWDVTPTGIGVKEQGSNVVVGEIVGSPSAPTFDEGLQVEITCFYKYLTGPPTTPPEWYVDIEIDGARIARLRAYNHEWKTSNSSGFDLAKGGLYSTSGATIVDKTYPAIASWKAAGGGAHGIRCVLDPDHRLSEENEANNLTEKTIQVKAAATLSSMKALGQAGAALTPTPSTRAGDRRGAPAPVRPAAGAVPAANTKSCRTSLSAKVALDPAELVSPGFQPTPDGVPEPKLTLTLQGSGAKGNHVFCDYASNKGDVTLSTTLPCKEASPSGVQHGYRCAP